MLYAKDSYKPTSPTGPPKGDSPGMQFHEPRILRGAEEAVGGVPQLRQLAQEQERQQLHG